MKSRIEQAFCGPWRKPNRRGSRGEGHGYHARSIGFILDELSLRICGQRIGEVWREQIAEPLDLDFWIGLPESEHHRVAKLYPGKYVIRKEEKPFYSAMQESGSNAIRAFSSLKGFQSAGEMNEPAAWSGGFPAFGGVGSAEALAKFYQVLLGSIDCEVVTPELRSLLTKPIVNGLDEVLALPTSFAAGSMFDPIDEAGNKLRQLFGPSKTAFGHPGAGGSHAFCDPESGLSFAYTMNQMELGLFPGSRCLSLIQALYS